MKSISEALRILGARSKKYYAIIGIVFLLLFVCSFISGYHLYQTNKSDAMNHLKVISQDSFVQMTLNAFQEKNYFTGFLLILGNNIKSIAVILFSGLIFILPPLFSIAQALSLGLIMGISFALKPLGFWHAVFTIIVAALEFSAVFLACYEGTNLGLSIFRKKDKKKNRPKGFGQTFSECMKIFVLIVAMLTIAAFIETIGIAVFGSKIV